MTPLIKANSTVLFQGDSITDAGRNRADPANLGSGYALLAGAWFGASHPELNVKFLNRGIGGNRAADLRARWKADCLNLKPDWVSILIGINDTWRRYDSGDPTSTKTFEDNYRAILEAIKTNLDSRLIMAEPFVLPYPADRKTWREDLDPKIEVVHKLAEEYQAILLPLDKIFTEALKTQDAAYWTPDGVHPSPAGHALIARTWLRAVEAL
ncbi:MAG: SGNH/GDSL hydrolase family protein [Chloroflexi bacterium]|nr:SGNH/GDSL hydrolase family protein [Chloroflexota bacterium]OJV99782.1 MAG: GDSL family lipase [Chloroflexi bacterium 54-19]